MTITYSATARDIITGALRDRRVIAIDDDPEAAELAYGMGKLNELLKELAAEGVSPWTDTQGTATITAATASVTLSPRPVDVLDARLYVSATYERPLTRMERGEFNNYPNKTQVGDPLIYVVDETPTAVTMTVWPVPSANKTVNYSYARVVEDLVESGAPDVPQMWIKGLRDMLVPELEAFSETTPNQLRKAAISRQKLLDHDRPESYTLEADM